MVTKLLTHLKKNMSLFSSLFGSNKEKLEREKKEKEITSNLEIDLNGRDELFLEATKFIITRKLISEDLIQRKFKLGFNRANLIMDQLEISGVLGPFEDTTSQREVLVSDLDSIDITNQLEQEKIDKLVQKREEREKQKREEREKQEREEREKEEREEREKDVDFNSSLLQDIARNLDLNELAQSQAISNPNFDNLFFTVAEEIIKNQKVSVEMIRSKISFYDVDYRKMKKSSFIAAGEIMDQLESIGVVSPYEGEKPLTLLEKQSTAWQKTHERQVLITDLDTLNEKILGCSWKEITQFREKVGELNKQLVLDRLSELKIIFDKDNNGVIDIIEDANVFQLFFKKNQNIISEKDASYIQKFVKVSNYLKTKSQNIQHQYTKIIELDIESLVKDDSSYTPIEVSTFGKEVNPEWGSETYPIDEMIGLLKNQKNTYDSLLYHSLSLISSLTNNDMITFYEIYEVFDKLNIFNSNFENELSQKLSNVEEGLKEIGEGLRSISQELRGVMYSIDKMENSITNQLNGLSYTMENSIGDLNNSINSELKGLNSSVQVNNLLTGIQTYQTYKLNKNLKS